MFISDTLSSPEVFSEILFEKMKRINPAIADMELYEFRYALNNPVPEKGWDSVQLDTADEIEQRISRREFYASIQIKPRVDDHIVLDENIVRLTNMLFVGLVTGEYDEKWVQTHFYFDVRGFFFLHRTVYFTEKILAHFGGKPYRQFEQKQKGFERLQDVGYKAFKNANADVDQLFIESVQKLIAARGTPILLAVAGPTAAGKTEIVARLRQVFEQAGQHVSSIEMDNFLTDRDYREEKGIFTLGKEALHFELFEQSLEDITHGKKISIPRYDFIFATSSHDRNGNLKPGGVPIEIEPADIIFIEGNFPFLFEEVVHLIGLKVVYLTDDPVRLKRKWKRDIDYRKKYEPTYFRNRFFKDQFIMAQIAYRPQMEVCDMVVDTTGAALWTTPEVAEMLASV
jgi:uridine kinase